MIYNPDNWPVEASTVKSVSPYDDGGCSITGTNGWSLFISQDEVEATGVPVVGEELITLGGGIGCQIRGIFIGGRKYRYQSREQAEIDGIAWLAYYEAKKHTRYQENINEWLARTAELDDPFRARLIRFTETNPDFWKDSGEYELFCVEQANALYGLAMQRDDPVAWLDEFYKASWEDQKVLFPGLDEGHSGNTFGGMVALAKAVAEGKNI